VHNLKNVDERFYITPQSKHLSNIFNAARNEDHRNHRTGQIRQYFIEKAVNSVFFFFFLMNRKHKTKAGTIFHKQSDNNYGNPPSFHP